MIKLENSWKNELKDEFLKTYMINLKNFLLYKSKYKKIYPPMNKIFECFNCLPFDKVKVIIIGQDPYCFYGQAHGLSFSVMPNVKIPPSLRNIYKELYNDVGIIPSKIGYLMGWLNQGVFLLNSTLTVEEGKPGSHFNKGWEIFTDKVISILSKKKTQLIFVLWGNFAKKKKKLINLKKHVVITSSHPSPYSAYNGFFGSKPFSKINDYLILFKKDVIDWNTL